MVNAINATSSEDNENIIYKEGIKVTPRNEVVALNADGNVKISESNDEDLQPWITRDSEGRLIVAYATKHSILEQDLTLAYSEDGSTWTTSAQ